MSYAKAFLSEWRKTITDAASLKEQIIKYALIFIAVFTPSFVPTDKVCFRSYSGGDPLANGATLDLHPSIGMVVSGIVLFFIAAFTAGVAYVRFSRLKVGSELEKRGDDYFLSIINSGFQESETIIRLESVRDDAGRKLPGNPPFELPWMDVDDGKRPRLSCGHPYYVKILRYMSSGYDTSQTGRVRVLISSVGMRGDYIQTDLFPNDKNKSWFEVSIGTVNNVKWFSVLATGPKSEDIEIGYGIPPFLASLKERHALSSLFKFLRRKPS